MGMLSINITVMDILNKNKEIPKFQKAHLSHKKLMISRDYLNQYCILEEEAVALLIQARSQLE
jgi:hypothetical protein